MPCRDYNDGYGPDGSHEAQKRLNDATRAACEAFRELESMIGGPVTMTSRLSKASLQWWEKHQEEDRKRKAADAERKRIAAVKSAAKNKLLNTLTVEEMEVLGLNLSGLKKK